MHISNTLQIALRKGKKSDMHTLLKKGIAYFLNKLSTL